MINSGKHYHDVEMKCQTQCWHCLHMKNLNSYLDYLLIFVCKHRVRRMHGVKSTWLVTYGPLAKYVKLWVAHAPGMPGTFYPLPRVSDPDMHYGTCMTHVPWCMPGSLTSGVCGSRCRGKRSRHSRRMRNPQFYVSGKGPMTGRFNGFLWTAWQHPQEI